MVSQIAANIGAVGGRRAAQLAGRSVLGRQPQRAGRARCRRPGARRGPRRAALGVAAQQRAGRGGLALAVLVANLTGVQHAFWVVFGTLSVLRSNALNTGQNVLRALLGTRRRVRRSAARCVALIGTNTTVLWVLLPLAVLLAGRRAGGDLLRRRAGRVHADAGDPLQHHPAGGLAGRPGAGRGHRDRLRRQPGGRAAVLAARRGGRARRALAEAYVDSANYLAGAVSYGMGRCDRSGPRRPAEPTRRGGGGGRRLAAAWTTPSAATWPSAAPSRCRWPR